MSKTKIEWTDVSWNPVRGCSRVSAGCQRCYAERMAARFSGTAPRNLIDEPLLKTVSRVSAPYYGFAATTASGPRWTGRVELIEAKLTEPLHWRKPRMVFVNSMSDLWHESLPLRDIAKIYAVMRLAHWHEYQVLTKRPEVRLAAFNSSRFWELVEKAESDIWDKAHSRDPKEADIPTPWIWEGVSVEDRKNKDRIDVLRQTPAALRFLSLEPLLEDLGTLDLTGIGWVIVGGESGPGARPMNPDWPRSVRDQCKAAGVKFFFKQWGEWGATAALGFGGREHLPTHVFAKGDGTGTEMIRVGKRAAGRLLDGRIWDETPEAPR